MNNSRKPVITLCGSSRYKDVFEEINEKLTMNGYVVFSLGMFAHSKGIELTEQETEMLREIHFQKIDMSDAIYVIDKDGYIGSSTQLEINYAYKTGKQILYYSTDKEIINEKN